MVTLLRSHVWRLWPRNWSLSVGHMWGKRAKSAPRRPTDRIARAVELALYSVLLALAVGFLLVATGERSEANAPGRTLAVACVDDHQVLAEVSRQVGEDLTAVVHLRQELVGEAYGRTYAATGQVGIDASVPCTELSDTIRHEYAHVLQLRACGPGWCGGDHERAADEFVRLLGGEDTPYIDRLGEPDADTRRAAAELLAEVTSRHVPM